MLCPSCREQLKRAAAAGSVLNRQGTLCFQCYRAELDRDNLLKRAGEIDTASVERFQAALPFEPVNRPRLAMLKVDRTTARLQQRAGIGQYVDRRTHAQIAARHALRSLTAGVEACRLAPVEHQRMMMGIHAAELQLPESWLPFVVSR